MLPKLTAFYMKVLLPELAVPRHKKCPGIREPGLWFSTDEPIHSKKQPAQKSEKNNKHNRPKKKVTDSTVSVEDTCNRNLNNSIPGCSRETPLNVSLDQHQGQRNSANTSKRYRSTRGKQKFLERKIRHRWFLDDSCINTKWYEGYVIGIISGKDGDQDAVYEILYEGDDNPYEVEHLLEDYRKSFVEFLDL